MSTLTELFTFFGDVIELDFDPWDLTQTLKPARFASSAWFAFIAPITWSGDSSVRALRNLAPALVWLIGLPYHRLFTELQGL